MTVSVHISEPEAVKYAGVFRRATAALIDGLIVSIVPILAFLPLFLSSVGNFQWDYFEKLHEFAAMSPFTYAIGSLFIYCSSWLYEVLQVSSTFRATLGQRCMGLQVCNLQNEQVSFQIASARYFYEMLPSLAVSAMAFNMATTASLKSYRLLFIVANWAMIVWAKRKQTIADMIAATVVIKKK